MEENTMKKLTSLALFICLSSVTPFASADLKSTPSKVEPSSETALEAEVSKPAHNFPIAEQLSTNALASQRNDYLAKRGWQLGRNQRSNDPNDAFYIGWGEASINASTNDISFADARIAAFEKALLAAKGQYAKEVITETMATTINENFRDERPVNAQELLKDNSAARSLLHKLQGLSDAALDALLEKLGENPEDYAHEAKQNIAKDIFTRRVTSKSLAKVAGFRTLVSFEDNHAVGVIVVHSHKLAEQAKSISQGSVVANNTDQKRGPSVLEQLSQQLPSESNYIFQHGLRVLNDEYGNPTLVAFSQSGVRATNHDSKFMLNSAIKAAKSSARSMAEGRIADFLNGTVALTSESTLESSDVASRVFGQDGERLEEASSIGKMMNEFIKQNSKMKLKGLNTLKTWTANHPETGHLITGEVLVWSPYTRDQVTNYAAKKRPSSNHGGDNLQKATNKLRSSADFNDDASF
tara:strand:+ start:721 stop:2124 length:1404 start_codon:yes stop_codon:yes gene_type:complete